MRRLLAGIVAIGVLAGCGAPSVPPVPPTPVVPDPGLPQRLVEAVRGEGAVRHLEELQRIADTHAGNRALGTPGYDASVEYAARVLREAGYTVETPQFTVRRFVPGDTRLVVGGRAVAVELLAYSPAGEVRGPLAVIAQDETSGCEAADYAGVATGSVVLVRRGACPFAQKSITAAAAGMAAVIVANDADGPLTGATLGEEADGALPTVGVTRADADALLAGAAAELTVQAGVEETTSRNVVAQTTTGDPGEVVMAGAHLDSVPAGPGINDNGSGVALLLETAVRLGGAPAVANAVRFGFWGAEEVGLVGSTRYVEGLTDAERARVAAYLNVDMAASPNAGYLVYDGDDSDQVGEGAGPPGSAAIEKLLVDGLSAAGVAADGADFTGRSDYGPFIERGIPSGGVFTGAEREKTPAQAQKWGGTAGEAYDGCYHQACDTLVGVDRVALDRNADAVAFALATLALSTEVLGRP
ncbi:M28 family peptidase [Pseudonocardia sp.]|uniref:M28 family peptidase n=1 Tax=Pseudonocardia sp. TaxID=60912 RepID=UPI003D0F5264